MSLDMENCLLWFSSFSSCLSCYASGIPMGVAFDIPWKHSLIANFLFLWLLQFSHSFCSNDP